MATHFASHVRESVIGPDAKGCDGVATTAHEMESLKQLACVVLGRAVEDAEGVGWNARACQAEAKQFLLNMDGMLEPWCVLARIRTQAVVEYALRRGYDQRVPVLGIRPIARSPWLQT